MAVYDDETQKKPGSAAAPPDKIGELEQQPDTTSNLAGDKSAEATEEKSLDDRLGSIKDSVAGGEDTGFYRPGKGMKGKQGSGLAALRGTFRKRGLVLGIGGGVVATVVGFGFLFNFLHTFQLDHFFKNTDAHTSKRLMASLDSRNKYLTQAYIRIRATEIEGGTAGDNLYFKANKVDTGSPVADWYKTMRSSKFEQDMLDNQGIVFVSMVDKDGKISPAKITGSGAVDPKLISQYNLTNIKTTDDLVKTLNKMPQEDLEKVFTVESFDSHKAARKSLKEAVNTEIPWQRVFKRRHMRQDYANKTGIKNWRLFEKTRDKIAADKQAVKDKILNKIIDKYYSNNPASAQFMKCLFSNGRCSTTSDPVDPANETATPDKGSNPDELANQDKNPDSKDAKGNTVAGDTLDTSGAGNEIQDAIDKSIKNEAEGAVANEADQTIGKFTVKQELILALKRTLAGDTVKEGVPVNPTKFWTWAKRIANIHAMLVGADGASKLAKMIYNARTSQLDGIYATYQMANDQMKSGQLVGDELNAFYDSTKNLGNSEGWQTLTGEINNGKASAASTTNLDKQSYCNIGNKDNPRNNPNIFAWMCDDQKPGGDSNAKSISDGYTKTIGPAIAPIATAVNDIQGSWVGKAADYLTNFIDSVIGKIVDPVVTAVLDNTGLGKTITDFMSTAMIKVLDFLGASPMFDGQQAGLGNLLVAGAAVSAESSTRASGGMKSTAQSLAYSNQLAHQYDDHQKANESVMTRYASLNNPDSLASNALFAVSSNTDLSHIASKVGSYFSSMPSLIGDIFAGKVFAQQPQDGSAVAKWAGVTTYDIPQACINLDPLDPDYLSKSSNVSDIGLSPTTLGYDTMRDTNKFWAAVYDKLKDDPDAETKAEKIYNCALLDARSMGDLGALYGYDKDNAYQESGSLSQTPGSSTTNPNVYLLGDSLTAGMRDGGDLASKLKAKGWQNVNISAQCGRHTKLDGVSCPGTLVDPGFPGGFKQADQDADTIKNVGAVVIGLGTNDPGDPGFSDNVSQLVDKIHGMNSTAKIYWINLYSTDGSASKLSAMNSVLTNLSQSKNFTVIDWATSAPPNYQPGNIHPLGHYGEMADVVVNTLGAPQTSTGSVTPTDNGGGVVPGDIVQTALGLAWDTRMDADGVKRINKSDAKPSYQVAMPKYNGSNTPMVWSDCGVFVSTVMRASGVDPNYPLQGTWNMKPYLLSHPDKYQVITTNAQTSEGMQPGDIIINDDHTMIYVGPQPKGYDTVDASLGDRVPGAKVFAPYPDQYKKDPKANYNYIVVRPKK